MRLAALLPALTVLVSCAAPADAPAAPAPSTGLWGAVTDADGTPVAGAFITARDAAAGVAWSVRTGVDGAYHLPVEARPGLEVRVHAIGLEARSPVAVEAPSERLDLRAARTDDVFAQLPSSAYLGALPDGDEKRRFILDCGGCHQFNRVRGEAGPLVHGRGYWAGRTAQMLAFAGADSGFPVIGVGRDADATADWLVQHLGAEGDPLPVLTPPPFEVGPERVLITEYDVPARQDLPHDLMLDPDGQIVVTGMMMGQMYTLDPATGAWASTRNFPGARALDVGADGVWWVLLGTPRQVARYDPASGERATFDIGVYPHSIARDAAGRVWYNAHFSKSPETIAVLDPATGETRTFEVPTPPRADGGTTIPYGLRIDADGVLWGTQLIGNRLVRFDPATEAFDLYELPTAHSGPRRPDVGPDGRIWVPEFAAGKLAVFDPATEAFTEHPLPVPDALPYVVRVADDGVVWVATGAADAVLRFFPDEGRWTVHPLPTRGALVRHMELDASGAAWIAYGNSPAVDPKVARVEVLD